MPMAQHRIRLEVEIAMFGGVGGVKSTRSLRSGEWDEESGISGNYRVRMFRDDRCCEAVYAIQENKISEQDVGFDLFS